MTANVGPIQATVATFARILNEPLKVESSKKGQTQGYTIRVPLDQANAYTLVERQLAHRLFRSDARARASFADEFVNQLVRGANAAGLPALDFAENKVTVEKIVDLLENRRVSSLWRLLYPGSFVRMEAALQRASHDSASRPHDSFFHLMVCIDAGHLIPSGLLDRFQNLFEQALGMVERKSFGATLAVARWLLSRLTYEMFHMRTDKGENGGAAGDGKGEGDPPLTQADKLQLLREVFSGFGSFPKELNEHYSDYAALPRQSKGELKEAGGVDVRQPEQLQAMLEASERAMEREIERVQTKLLSTTNVGGTDRFPDFKVSFVDTPSLRISLASQPEVQRLSSIFRRILGRRATSLSDCGTEIDVESLIARRVSGADIPCFKNDQSGRGFKIRILIDRSGSMTGIRTRQAEEAATLLSAALQLPAVDLAIWGFQSPDDGEVRLTRFEGPTLDFSNSKVEGETPMHVAIHRATNELLGGTESKHLLVLSDGLPMCAGKERRMIDRRTLVRVTGEEVQRARAAGIHVTALLIGERRGDALYFEAENEDIHKMFGNERYWSIADQTTIRQRLVELVSRSFAQHLQAR